MRKKFALNLAFLIGANLLVKPFWIFGIDRVVQNTLGAAEYGLYFAVFNYSLLFSVLLDLGLNNFNNRAVSRVPARLSNYFGNLLTLKIGLGIMYFLVTLIIAYWNGFNSRKMLLLSLLLCNQVLLTLILFFRSNLQALQWFKVDSLISISDRWLSIVFCASLLWFHFFELNVFSFVLAQSLALLITCLIAGLVVFSKAGFRFKFWSPIFRRKVLLSTLPYALLVFLMTIYGRVDAVLLENLLGKNGAAQAGVYAASFRIYDAANQFGFLFSTILLPLFAANFKQQKLNSDLFFFGLQTIAVFAVLVASVCAVWSSFIISVLYKQQSELWQLVFIFTMLGFIPASLIYIMGTLLTAKGEIYALCKISAVGVVFNFFANYLLIPKFGAMGSAACAFATNAIVFLLHAFLVVKKTNVQFKFSFVFAVSIFVIFSFAIAIFLKQLPMFPAVSISLSMAATILLAVLFQLLPLNALKQMLSNLNARVVKR